MDELLNIISKYATMRLKADGPGKFQGSGMETLLNLHMCLSSKHLEPDSEYIQNFERSTTLVKSLIFSS